MQCTAYGLSTDRLNPPPPLQPLQQYWQHSYIYFPNTTSGYDAEHVHSTFWSAIFREMPVTANSKILQVITYSYVTEEHKRTQRNNLEAWDCPVPSWGQCSSFRCETDSRWAPVIKQSQCSSYMSNKLHCMLSPVPSIHCGGKKTRNALWPITCGVSISPDEVILQFCYRRRGLVLISPGTDLSRGDRVQTIRTDFTVPDNRVSSF